MFVVPPLGDGRVLQDVYCVQEKNVTSSSLLQGVPQLKTFCQVINDMDHMHLCHAIKSSTASVDYVADRVSRELVVSSQKHDQGLNPINEKVKDGAGRAVNSIIRSGKLLASSAAHTATRCLNDEEDTHMWLLRPQFDVMKRIQVWLDKHQNIAIEVYGENMVLGMHVLYLVDGEEKLRTPCTVKNMMPQWVENSKDPHKPNMAQAFSNLPLQFSTQGIKGLTFKEPGGCYRIQLAFGSHGMKASEVEPRIFDSLHVLQVAERFSTEPPTNLIDLLIFWGTATAQAQCTAAYYAIQENPRDADDIVKKTLMELPEVPPEFDLLDRLLSLADTTQFSLSVLNKLPPEMSQTLRDTTIASEKSALVVPYFPTQNGACRLEFELYCRLKETAPKVDCFNLSSMQCTVDKARYEASTSTALKLANYGLAGARMYEIRRYLTERKTALGLIGSTQAGKSTFASQAFKVESHPGAGKNARTRVLRHWTLPFPEVKNRQFTLIDFPGSTDHAAPDWYIRGKLLASVLVVVLSMKEINGAQAVALVEKLSIHHTPQLRARCHVNMVV